MYCDFKKTSKMKWHFKIPINFIEDTGTLVSLCKKKKKKKLKIGARVSKYIYWCKVCHRWWLERIYYATVKLRGRFYPSRMSINFYLVKSILYGKPFQLLTCYEIIMHWTSSYSTGFLI